MHAVSMPPLSQTWMCVTAACPFSRGVHPTACIFLPSWWGGRAGELCAGILVQRNVFLHTQWLVMGTVRTTCNCSLERALSLIMATCRSVEMVRLLWKCSTSEGFCQPTGGQNTADIFSFLFLIRSPPFTWNLHSLNKVSRVSIVSVLHAREKGKRKWWNSVLANNNLHFFDDHLDTWGCY